MPKASKETASESATMERYEGHFEHFDGATPLASRPTAPTPTLPRSSRAYPTTSASANTGATSSRAR
jgi:hypothetical protein